MKSYPVPLFAACWVLTFTPAAPAASIIIEAGQTHTLQQDLVLDGDDVLEIARHRRQAVHAGRQPARRSARGRAGPVRWSSGTAPSRDSGRPPSCDHGRVVAAEFPALDAEASGQGKHHHRALRLRRLLRRSTSRTTANRPPPSATTPSGRTRWSRVDKDVGKSPPLLRRPAATRRRRKLFQGNLIYRAASSSSRPRTGSSAATATPTATSCIGLRIGLFAEGEGTRRPRQLPPPAHADHQGVPLLQPGLDLLHRQGRRRRAQRHPRRRVDRALRRRRVPLQRDHRHHRPRPDAERQHRPHPPQPVPRRHVDSRPGSMSAASPSSIRRRSPATASRSSTTSSTAAAGWTCPAIEVAPEGVRQERAQQRLLQLRAQGQVLQAAAGHDPRGLERRAGGGEAGPPGLRRLQPVLQPERRSRRATTCCRWPTRPSGRTPASACNDIPRGGKVDEQADPKFKGPIPKAFPFANDDIKARQGDGLEDPGVLPRRLHARRRAAR